MSINKIIYLVILVAVTLCHFNLSAQTIYLDATKGNDNYSGTIDKPLKTFTAIANLVNSLNGEGSTIIKIAAGTYHLNEKVQFENSKNYNERNRFVIEAMILPDDTAWTPAQMPVIISTAKPSENFGFKCSVGLDVEINHVTIKGLKFLGNPLPEIYYYPIGRQGKDLEDLSVTQCLFVGDEDTLPMQSGVLAHGNKISIDHCIFYNCKNSVVFYFADDNRAVPRHGSEMKYCIVDGAYESGIWTASPDVNFIFHNNIITRCKYTWIHNLLNQTVYKIDNCIFTDNEFGNTKLDQNYEYVNSDISYIENNVTHEGSITLVKKDDILMPVNYLNVVPETFGSDLGAGLFINRK